MVLLAFRLYFVCLFVCSFWSVCKPFSHIFTASVKLVTVFFCAWEKFVLFLWRLHLQIFIWITNCVRRIDIQFVKKGSYVTSAPFTSTFSGTHFIPPKKNVVNESAQIVEWNKDILKWHNYCMNAFSFVDLSKDRYICCLCECIEDRCTQKGFILRGVLTWNEIINSLMVILIGYV